MQNPTTITIQAPQGALAGCSEHLVVVDWIMNTEAGYGVYWCPEGHEIIEEN